MSGTEQQAEDDFTAEGMAAKRELYLGNSKGYQGPAFAREAHAQMDDDNAAVRSKLQAARQSGIIITANQHTQPKPKVQPISAPVPTLMSGSGRPNRKALDNELAQVDVSVANNARTGAQPAAPSNNS